MSPVLLPTRAAEPGEEFHEFFSLLLTASLVIFISVSYLVAVRYLKHREASSGKVPVLLAGAGPRSESREAGCGGSSR